MDTMRGRPIGGHIARARGAMVMAVWMLAAGTSSSFGQEPTGPAEAPSGRAGSMAVLPYFAPPGALPDRYGFVVYTVTDVIRLTLLEENRFALFERGEIDEAAAGLPERWMEDGSLCLALAGKLGADFFIRGYVTGSGDDLRVIHILVETASGRTLHMGERTLGSGPELVGRLEESAREFSDWVNHQLPNREPDTVYVETEKIVIRPASTYALEFGAAVSFPQLSMTNYLAPSPGVRAGIRFKPLGLRGFSFGLDGALYLLNQRQSFFIESGQNIDVLFMPAYLCAKWTALGMRGLSVELSAMAGPAAVFGLVSPELIAYFRPSVAAGADIVLFPSSGVSIVTGVIASWTFWIYGNLHMPSIEPRIAVRFNQ